MKKAHKTAFDVVNSQLNIHPTPVIQYVADTRSTEYKPHVILRALRSWTEATNTATH